MIKTIDSKGLYEILKSPQNDYQVVDVRDDDIEYGHILNSINIPSHQFHDLDKVDDKLSKPKLIFHCMLSQVRGPKCAKRYQDYLQLKGIRKEIFVLKGGYEQFYHDYKQDSSVIKVNKPIMY